jgi:hypothetical protein
LPLLQHAAAFYFIVFLGMKYTVAAFLAITLLMTACKSNPSKNTPAVTIAKDSVAAQQSFFPVPDYIGGQLKMIDSLHLPLRMTFKSVGAKDRTRNVSIHELRDLAQNFRQPDISDPALKKFYTETNIADRSIPSVTLIYATTNNTLPIQKINVFIKADPVENDKVTGIYMEKIFSRNDTIFSQKLYWKTGKNMQVITEKQIKGITMPVEQVKIIWDASS